MIHKALQATKEENRRNILREQEKYSSAGKSMSFGYPRGLWEGFEGGNGEKKGKSCNYNLKKYLKMNSITEFWQDPSVAAMLPHPVKSGQS